MDDAFGYELTANDAAALESWNRTVQAFLAHGATTPQHLADALDRDPALVLAHLAKGFFLLLLGRGELVASAREALETASALIAEGGTARERAYRDALALYLDGDLTAAADRLDAALKRFPQDALLLKLVHAIRFVLGDARGMRESIEAVLPAYEGHTCASYVNGCYAFALEETGEYRAAEARGRDAVLRAPDDAWGVHAVAHVFDMSGRSREGVMWLAEQPATWAHCNNFRYHVWWHLALFHLDRGETDAALRLYDREVRSEHSDDYRDIANAASLLMRLEFEGVDVGSRWEEMAALCEARTEDGCVVFADLHYLLALGASGRDAAAAAMLARMQADAATRRTDMARVARESGVSAAEGLMAFAGGDYQRACAKLRAARPRLHGIGGSHAQRDVFTRILIEAALRAGMLDTARSELEARARRRGALDGYAERRLARIDTLGAARAAI